MLGLQDVAKFFKYPITTFVSNNLNHWEKMIKLTKYTKKNKRNYY
jgi:hypothetical protein